MSGYLDNSGREDVLSGGSRMIGIDTPKGPYRVWVKRTGNNPRLRVLRIPAPAVSAGLAAELPAPSSGELEVSGVR